MNSPALFLDRDGVVNHEIGYLHRAEDVRWVDGILPLCRTAMALGYKLVVVTNQSGIARGYYTMQQFDELTAWMQRELASEGVRLDAVYCCPFHPDGSVEEYRREHVDRKPSPGMLQRAACELGVALTRSVMIGDRCSDIGAANAAGLRQAFLIAGTETDTCSGAYMPIGTLAEAEEWLRRESSVEKYGRSLDTQPTER